MGWGGGGVGESAECLREAAADGAGQRGVLGRRQGDGAANNNNNTLTTSVHTPPQIYSMIGQWSIEWCDLSH